MKLRETGLEGCVVIEPTVFDDGRGYFFESFNQKTFEEKTGIHIPFVQDNQSLSHRGILRGLHFQKSPHAQGKFVRVITGAVLDVALDIRKDSPTYGQFVAEELTASNKRMLFIPPGFAHGFATLEDNTIFTYKCTDYYHPEAEGGILWNSPSLNIPWRLDNPVLSAKDEQLTDFAHFNSPF